MIAKASNAYETVLNDLETVSLEFEEERQALTEQVGLLQNAIRAVILQPST